MNEVPVPLDLPGGDDAIRTERGSSSHIPALDGLRGFAVLLVLIFHLSTFSFAGRGLAVTLAGVVSRNGWMGVEIFFTLSGFLITNILVKTVVDPHYFRSFYVRRTLRIAPLYYGVLLVAVACSVPLHIRWNGSFAYLLVYLQNYLPTERLWLSCSLGTLRLSHFWSLAVEEQFYLVWPAVVWFFKGRSRLVAVPIALIILGPIVRWIAVRHGVSGFTLYTQTPFRLDGLAWGALGALTLRGGRYRLTRVLRWASLGLGSFLVLGILADWMWWKDSIAALGMLTCGILLSIVHPGSLLERIYRVSFLRWLGRYSYGIYIYHYIFLGLFSFVRGYIDEVTGVRPLGAFAELVSGITFSACLAWVSYHVYESRFLKLKDTFGRYAAVASGPHTIH